MNVMPFASRRRVAFAAFVALLVLAALAGATPAVAKATPCAQQVIADWYDNGRVDKIYPLHCYREAIDSLGPDIRTYSGAEEAIQRALAAAALGKPDPGSGNGSSPVIGLRPVPPGMSPIAVRNTSTEIRELPFQPIPTSESPTTSTAGPSSVPVPLIVLAGLAILLLAAGGAGYIARRIKGNRGGPPAAGT